MSWAFRLASINVSRVSPLSTSCLTVTSGYLSVRPASAGQQTLRALGARTGRRVATGVRWQPAAQPRPLADPADASTARRTHLAEWAPPPLPAARGRIRHPPHGSGCPHGPSHTAATHSDARERPARPWPTTTPNDGHDDVPRRTVPLRCGRSAPRAHGDGPGRGRRIGRTALCSPARTRRLVWS